MTIIPNSPEFFMIVGFTIATILIKLILSIYIGLRIQKKKKEQGVMGLEFLTAVFVMIFTLFLSRIFYAFFDYYYTKFDMTLYAGEPQVWFWKIGQSIATLGQAYIIYILDKKILNFKFKGIISVLMVIGAVVTLVYPVHNLEDFNTLSIIGIIPMIGIIILPLVFISIARKSSGDIRKTAWMLVFGILLFVIGSLVINAGILTALQTAFNRPMDVYMYLVQTITKGIGICLIAYAATKFNP